MEERGVFMSVCFVAGNSNGAPHDLAQNLNTLMGGEGMPALTDTDPVMLIGGKDSHSFELTQKWNIFPQASASGVKFNNRLLTTLSPTEAYDAICSHPHAAHLNELRTPTEGFGRIYVIRQIHLLSQSLQKDAEKVGTHTPVEQLARFHFEVLKFLTTLGSKDVFPEGSTHTNIATVLKGAERYREMVRVSHGLSTGVSANPLWDDIPNKTQMKVLPLESPLNYYLLFPGTELHPTSETGIDEQGEATILAYNKAVDTNQPKDEQKRLWGKFIAVQNQREQLAMEALASFYQSSGNRGKDVVLIFGGWHQFADDFDRAFPEGFVHPGLVEVTYPSLTGHQPTAE